MTEEDTCRYDIRVCSICPQMKTTTSNVGNPRSRRPQKARKLKRITSYINPITRDVQQPLHTASNLEMLQESLPGSFPRSKMHFAFVIYFLREEVTEFLLMIRNSRMTRKASMACDSSVRALSSNDSQGARCIILRKFGSFTHH